uniref:Uncharacterized protein n=1 Tax=Chenopodium quinoa TaxID=63459 RepID=A0A803NB63_CHEQI
MQRLKGLWMEEPVFIPSFSQLRVLCIFECKGLTYFPPCPRVKELKFYKVSEALTFCMGGGGVQNIPISLKELSIDNSCVFNSLFTEFVGSIDCIELIYIEDLGTAREGFKSCAASSVRDLTIRKCRGLENLGITWKSLHSLTSFNLKDRCKKPDGEDWPKICHIWICQYFDVYHH